MKTRLKQFWVDGETLTDKSFSVFGDLQKLELLSISYAENMKSRGLTSVSNLRNLEWLRVRKGKGLLCSDFVQAFSDEKLKKLLFLDLSECSELSDLGLITIAKNCPTLATLNLCWCLVGTMLRPSSAAPSPAYPVLAPSPAWDPARRNRLGSGSKPANSSNKTPVPSNRSALSASKSAVSASKSAVSATSTPDDSSTGLPLSTNIGLL